MARNAGPRRTVLGALLTPAVLVSALGYFVDIYDLLLFSIVRVPSLQGLGIPADQQLGTGVLLLNWQMAGLLLGGILWGVLGDKRGRVSVLFGSILLYSVANIANAFVQTIPQYAALRFLAGLGLAGELGAAVTLVSEILPKETRGYGTAFVAAMGISGAVVAWAVGSLTDWRTAYLIGGGLGLALLLTRFSLRDSSIFAALRRSNARRGDLLLLLRSRERVGRYIATVLPGMPLWFVVGILITFSPELARAVGVPGTVVAGTAVAACYGGLVVGDLASGFISQALGTRKWVMLAFLGMTAVLIDVYVFFPAPSVGAFYLLCGVLGFAIGYWAVFVTNAAEQFGTNLRATVATTVPNMIRGTVVPLTLVFQALAGRIGLAKSALVVGQATVLIAILALRALDEGYGKDLDYLETDAAAPPLLAGAAAD